MYSISLARIARKALAQIACTSVALAMTMGPAHAFHGASLDIDTAEWDGANTVTVSGKAHKPRRGGGDVELFDYNFGGGGISLGTTSPANSGNYSISVMPAALPCQVYVEQLVDGTDLHSTLDPPDGAPFDVTPEPPGCGGAGNNPPVAVNDNKLTSVDTDVLINVVENDYDPDLDGTTGGDIDPTSVVIVTAPVPTQGLVTNHKDGTVTFSPAPGFVSPPAATFTYTVDDNGSPALTSNVATVSVTVTEPGELPVQSEFKMLMNYELGMHCTGFEFAYCCVLPVYNSILTQVVKNGNNTGDGWPRLMEADPNLGQTSNEDAFSRQTVLRDRDMDATTGEFQKYVLRYWHDAQPRNDGRGKAQVPGPTGSPTLISHVEGNSLLAWNTVVDAAAIVDGSPDGSSGCFNGPGTDVQGPLKTGAVNGAKNVVLGNNSLNDTGCTFGVSIDNYQNAVWNHLYIYSKDAAGVEGEGGNPGGPAPDDKKFRLGLHVDYPANFGPAGHNMQGTLTWSTDHGTVVYTQMKVLEDLPITLTSPRIWEALGLPLTPFEDSIDFFGNPGLVGEESIRPFVEMKAQLHHFDGARSGGIGDPVFDGSDNEVIGFGTAPIDIPNCERCHSAAPTRCPDPAETPPFCTDGVEITNDNSPNHMAGDWAMVQLEIDFWKSYYDIDVDAGQEDWYARLKGAAISILAVHDREHGTSFTAHYPDNPSATAPLGTECMYPDTNPEDLDCSYTKLGPLTVPATPGELRTFPQNTRLGHESVICQKCHADNVIAVVKSANCTNDPLDPAYNPLCSGKDALIKPLTEAIHFNHRESSEFYCAAGLVGQQCAGGLDTVCNSGAQVCDGASTNAGASCTGDGDCDGGGACVVENDGVCEGGAITFTDASGRSGGCQGCHPAHRSDGVMTESGKNRYPITLNGDNAFEVGDNRLAAGGCFVGRDVHSNPAKDVDGAETPEHLNPVGQWLQTAVSQDGDSMKGLWCTNCHSQASQQIWKAEDCSDLIRGECVTNIREAGDNLVDVVNAINGALGTSTTEAQFKDWLDPADPAKNSARGSDQTSAIWAPDPGLCDYVNSYVAPGTYGAFKPAHDGNVAVVAVSADGPDSCPDTTLDFNGNGTPGEPEDAPAGDRIPCAGLKFHLCGAYDIDGDFNVALVGTGAADAGGLGGVFCTTPDCLASANPPAGTIAFPVPFSAATDGRDHWLSPGEPHCADCHTAPYVEQSGNVNAFAPFNYPRKASLMRYSRGHQDITCQGCHESIHGLYPVTNPDFTTTGVPIDSTSYAQAASLNADGSHGPVKCGACHKVGNLNDPEAVPSFMGNKLPCDIPGVPDGNCSNFDEYVSWMHTYTEESTALDTVCLNCHNPGKSNKRCRDNGPFCVDDTVWNTLWYGNIKWYNHKKPGINRIDRSAMDNAEREITQTWDTADPNHPCPNVAEGCLFGDPDPDDNGVTVWDGPQTDGQDPFDSLCLGCHSGANSNETLVACNNNTWKLHLEQGRVPEKIWEAVSEHKTGSTCGW